MIGDTRSHPTRKGGNPILVLKRKEGEFIWVLPHVQIVVVSVEGNSVRLGIKAPDDVLILRGPELVTQDGVPLEHALITPSMKGKNLPPKE